MSSAIYVLIKRLNKREGSEVLLLQQNIVIAFFCFVLLCPGIPHEPVFVVTLHDSLLVIVVILAGVTGWSMLNRSGQLTSATLVSVLLGTDLVYTLLADTFIFGEVFYPLKLLGVVFIVGASAIVAHTVTPVAS